MAAKKTASRSNDKYEVSSGNVFADLGLPDAEGRLTKAKLAHQISVLIRAAESESGRGR